MPAVWMLTMARLRTRWRPLLGIALLVGLASCAVLGAVIGAGRTESAYPRLLEATRAEDARVGLGGYGEQNPRFVEALRRLPQVADLGLASLTLMTPVERGRPTEFSPTGTRFAGLASVDGRAGWTINRPLILAGRRPDPDRPEEAGLNELLARRWNVAPGDTIRLRALTADQLWQALSGVRVMPAGPLLTLKVVAIERLPSDVALDRDAVEGLISLTPAFYRAYRDRVAHFPAEPQVRLRRGEADVAAFTAAVARLSRNSPEVDVTTRADLGLRVERAIRAQTIALAIFAVAATLAALVLIGQTVTRELFLAATADVILRALGASGAQLFAAALLPIGCVGAVGAFLGSGLAVLSSALMPIGLARHAEPSPGVALYPVATGVGVLATVVLVGALAVVPAWRLAWARRARPHDDSDDRNGSAVAGVAARAGLPPTPLMGVRMALEQERGPAAVPIRAALIGATAGVVSLVAALTFAAGLDRMLTTPRLYGWNFDAAAGEWQLDDASSRTPPWLENNPHVGAYSAVYFHSVRVDRADVYAAGLETSRGQVFPTMVEGRPPDGPGEIALGTKTLRRLGRDVGDYVQVESNRPATMRVVGRLALLAGEEDTAATGAVLTMAGMRRLEPGPGSGYRTFYIRYTPGADAAAALRSLRRPGSGVEQDVQLPAPPVDVAALGGIRGLPGVLAALLSLLAAATLAHLLVTSIRRRRREFAVLKALGFVRRQVSAVVAWQATTVAVVALTVGVPLGLALGRWAWTLLVRSIGLGAEPVTPFVPLAIVAVGTVVVANVVAAGPGWSAARTRPAAALQAE
jgi:ABC-type lipoprotein release transport system permease subunit